MANQLIEKEQFVRKGEGGTADSIKSVVAQTRALPTTTIYLVLILLIRKPFFLASMRNTHFS